MWKILLFVMAFSYLVLFLLLRSVLLPLKAVLMNLLSVAAAYGVLVVVFQYGWFDGFTGFESLGYINTMTPPFLLAIVFGLSMDYEVFLLSRIRERYEATGDNQRAVAEGLQASAKTISSAALIMVAVFSIFAIAGVPSIKEIGVGLAVAIALDATLVRLVLVPATMEIMGRWNWWLPKRLDRVLPHTDFEGRAVAGAAPRPEQGSSAARKRTAGWSSFCALACAETHLPKALVFLAFVPYFALNASASAFCSARQDFAARTVFASFALSASSAASLFALAFADTHLP